MEKKKMLLGELLIKENLITEEQLEKALNYKKETGYRLGHCMVKLRFLNDDTLAEILTKQCSQKCMVIKKTDIPETIQDQLSYDFCIKNKCIPVEIKNNKLIIGIADPYDINMMDDLKFLLNQEIIPKMATEMSIYEAIEKAYLKTKGKKIPFEKTKQKSDSHIINLVNNILFDAIDKGASDIHFETFEPKINLRYRVDGELFNQTPPDKKDINSIVSRIKVMANLNIAEKRLPQDGRILIKDKHYDVDIRVSIIPTIYGENIVLRILDKKRSSFELSTLGLGKKNEITIRDILKKSYGLILITGPTGSGKTTTLYSMIKILNSTKRKIITIEEPVEYKIENVNQVEVNPKINLTFASALRSFLRHDPDIIMVGEIRDKETAQIAVRAALTGHLVLSTVHTNDASSSVTRLMDMGIEPFLLSSTLQLVISQRLARKICKDCKTKIKKNNQTVFTGKGCDICQMTGYKGRTGIFEILKINEPLQNAINQKKSAGEIKQIAEKSGFKDLSKDGLIKVHDGITTKEEITRVINV